MMEREMESTIFNPNSLRLYLVTDRDLLAGITLPDLIDLAAAGGVSAVQLREKTAEGREFYQLAAELSGRLAARNIPFYINDRVDVAVAVPCAGVHLGQKDLPLPVARRILGPGKIIGLSVNNPVEALEGEAQGADYLGAGPVFSTRTKTDLDPLLGPEGLSPIIRATPLPVVAIGGINAANAELLNGLGLAGIAVVSAICAAADPRAAAAELRRRFRGM